MLVVIIVFLSIFGCLLVSTSHITHVNRASVAVIVCAVGWVIYVCNGSDFVISRHALDFFRFLNGVEPSNTLIKEYINGIVFIQYVGRATSVVLFLLATMSVIEILNNNGCFDFLSNWVRSYSCKKMLWTLTFVTFFLSANLDNLTTVAMMFTIMHRIVENRRQRMLIGSAIVLAACAGGCFTVIGDPTGLMFWSEGNVTASHFSLRLILPALALWTIPTFLIGRDLSRRVDIVWQPLPYRGDDTRLKRWQRVAMFVVGIGGLWFIPTFNSITKLPPFLGALCVLAVLLAVNEIANRKLNDVGQTVVGTGVIRTLQYGSIQMILFIMGVILATGVLREIGILQIAMDWAEKDIHSIWIYGLISGAMSIIVDPFIVAMTNISMIPAHNVGSEVFAQDGAFWRIIAFTTAVGGCLTCFSTSWGLALMKTERVRVGWYMRNIASKVLIGGIVGLFILWIETVYFI